MQFILSDTCSRICALHLNEEYDPAIDSRQATLRLPCHLRSSHNNLVGDANNTASRARTSVTSLLGLLVSALAEVVSSSVNDNGATNDALGANQLDQLVRGAALSVALAIGLEVTQVTDVALVVFGRAVRLVVGVDWTVALVWVCI